MDNNGNNNRMFDTLPSYQEAVIPTYDESISRPQQRQSLSYLPALEQVQSPLFSDSSSISSSHLAPASPPQQSSTSAAASPITLILPPNATLITPLFHNRALYELTSPLNGQSRSIFLAEVPTITKLSSTGHLPQIEKRHHLYKLFESEDGGTRHIAIDGRKTRCMQGTMLRRSADGTALVATNQGSSRSSSGDLIFAARLNGNVIEWIDAKGRVAAIDHMVTTTAADRSSQQETLEVLLPMSKKWLDMLVALWISRIHQATLREAEKERNEARAAAAAARDGNVTGRQRGGGGGLLDGSKSFLRGFIS